VDGIQVGTIVIVKLYGDIMGNSIRVLNISAKILTKLIGKKNSNNE